ncbi:MAG TPA: oligosaccharide flippase family protein [Planctomycetota bacterium]|nr:oligosaccharide flippase family protein [Planctomycetota bacterium]
MDHQSHAEAKVTKAPESVARGSVFLSLAAVWHAISGYVIFITGYHILKPGTYGDFMLVVWTMTTLEILVVDGLPRALAQAVAREPGAVRGLTRFGMIWTLLLGTALAALLFALAPFIAGTVWKDAALTTPLRLAGLDFVAFVGFAVMVQTLNGLRQYTRQAMAWFFYSTVKVVCVLVFLSTVGGVLGSILGYVLASLLGSIFAVILGMRAMPERDAVAASVDSRALARAGTPFALLSLALMAFLNADLWAVKPAVAAAAASAYAAAATLGRALFFVFRAVGDALFPAVARSFFRGELDLARAEARMALGWLFMLLLPVVGLAVGGAHAVMGLVYGSLDPLAGDLLRILSVLSASWTIAAILGLLLAAVGHPMRAAAILLLAAVVACGAFPICASDGGVMAVGIAGLWVVGPTIAALWISLVRVLQGAIPVKPLLLGLVGAVLMERALVYFEPCELWVVPMGALLLGAYLAVLVLAGQVPRRRKA